MNILVAGGAGYIGSHAVRMLTKAGHEVVVLDDLSHGYSQLIEGATQGLRHARFVNASIADHAAVVQALRESRIDAVMHFAAFIEVGESVADPDKYYGNNFCGSLALLRAMREANVERLVFSSTAAVYGNPLTVPITENQLRAPINPYGRSKMMVELAIEDFAAAYGLSYTILRYFNVAGATPDGVIGEAHEPETHLIPRVLQAAANGSAVGIFGTDYPTRDGTCVRDYIHVDDLVQAHVLALERGTGGRGNGAIYNLGSESGFTVREVIDTCSRVTGRKISTTEQPRREGDPAVLVASSAKIRAELGWERKYPELDVIVRHAWAWHQRSHAGQPLGA